LKRAPLIAPEAGFRVELGGSMSETVADPFLEEVEKHSLYYKTNFCNKRTLSAMWEITAEEVGAIFRRKSKNLMVCPSTATPRPHADVSGQTVFGMQLSHDRDPSGDESKALRGCAYPLPRRRDPIRVKNRANPTLRSRPPFVVRGKYPDTDLFRFFPLSILITL
jgi:hypothetical protein